MSWPIQSRLHFSLQCLLYIVPNDRTQRSPAVTPCRLQQSLPNYPNRATAQRGGSLKRSGYAAQISSSQFISVSTLATTSPPRTSAMPLRPQRCCQLSRELENSHNSSPDRIFARSARHILLQYPKGTGACPNRSSVTIFSASACSIVSFLFNQSLRMSRDVS